MFLDGILLILFLSPLACAAWLGMLWVAFRWFGIKPKEALRDISLPEAIFFGIYSFSAAYLVASQFSRFVLPGV